MADSQVTRIVSCVKITPRQIMEAEPNLFSNADFSAGATDWTVSGSPVLTGGMAEFDGTNSSISQSSIGLIEGDTYEIGCEIKSVAAHLSGDTNLVISLGGTCLPILEKPTTGIYRVVSLCGAVDGAGFLSGGCSTAPNYFSGNLDNVFCRRLIATLQAPVGITDCDVTIIVDGVSYASIHGYTPTRMTTTGDMSVGNIDIEGILALNGVSRDDIVNGIYNGAEVEYIAYDLETEAVRRTMLVGHIGEITLHRNKYIAEVRDLSQPLRQNMLELTSPTCRCERFGDYRCRIDLVPLTVTGTVGTSLGNRGFIDNTRTEDDNWFMRGVLVWGVGSANDGAVSKVKFYGDRAGDQTFELAQELANPILPTDAYTLQAGCDRTWARCKELDNAINFQGEPDKPNQDKLNEYGGQK